MNTDEFIKLEASKCLFLFPMRQLRMMEFISYTSSSDDFIIVPCKISEERYKVDDGYKVILKSIYPEFGEVHLYIIDLCNLLNNGSCELYIKENIGA